MKRRVKKKRELERVDLNRISVEEGIKIIKDKANEIFNSKSKLMSLEIEKMITKLDEEGVTNYLH